MSNDLFGYNGADARARNTDPDTSHAAAEEVSPHVRKLQADVLAYAVSRHPGGFIDPEMNEHFAVTSSTYRTRRSELVEKGLVEDTGERVSIGGRGRRHAVWRVTDRGRAFHAGSRAPLSQAA